MSEVDGAATDKQRASRFTRREVPWGLDIGAAWAWRLLLVGLLVYWLYRTFAYFSEISVPIAIALLLSALLYPATAALAQLKLPHWLSSALMVLGLIGLVVLMLVLAGQQVASQARSLADKVVKGLDEVNVWLREGPLQASDSQIASYIERAQDFITERALSGEFLGTATEFGAAFGHVAAGTIIALFATYFFLADGDAIWDYLVRFAPKPAQRQLHDAGHVAWAALNKFVRATLLVAAADAIGIAVWAWALGLPLVLALGMLVFLGAFIPLVGATLAGSVAVLVALVDGGPWTALWMLVGVIVVQQIEGHVLQPFLMGRLISVHPLAIIIGLAMGIVMAGIAGALLAVPAVAMLGALVGHFRDHTNAGLWPPTGTEPPSAENTELAHKATQAASDEASLTPPNLATKSPKRARE
jgi:putative heme transporter